MKLWRGIYKVFLEDDKLEYIIGFASIPDSLQEDFKSDLLKMLYNQFAFNKDNWVNGVNKVEVNTSDSYSNVKELEASYREKGDKIKVPVLINKYLNQEGKVLGFNLDREFGNSIDVLMVLNKKNILELTKEWLS